jgi:hypothetical protein
MLDKILDLFKDVKFYIILILIFIIGFLIFQNNNYASKLNYNNVILTDSISYYKNKADELYIQKESYIIENEDLKRINSDLSKEYNNLKENPIVVTKVETKYEIKEVYIESDKAVIDSLNNIISNFYNYNDNYLSLNASHKLNLNTNIGNLELTNISMNSNIYTNIIEKDKRLYLISRSDNPYLNITNVDGGFIDLESSKVLNKFYKRENKWSFGVSGGLYAIYGLANKKIDFGPGFGLSITYSFGTW